MDILTIQYLGQCGFLLEYNGTRIVTDPYLSDYVDKTFYTNETPWTRLYPPPVSLAHLHPDGVVISHSHGDHMDPWTIGAYIKQNGKAVFAAPEPDVDILSGMGVQRGNIIPARAGAQFSIGSIKIIPIPCAHTELHTNTEGCFYELSYLFICGNNKVFFGGDMSMYDGLDEYIKSMGCHLLLLPCNGTDEERTKNDIIGNIDHIQAARLTRIVDAPFVPMHHDLYEINGCETGKIISAAENEDSEVIVMEPMYKIKMIDGKINLS